MALQRLPVTTDVRQFFMTSLGGQLVRIDVWWQPSDENWYLSLAWQSGRRIVSGRRLVTDVDVLVGIVSDFSGALVVYGLTERIGRDSWLTSHELIFDSGGV